jgi:diadenosine tetraphosphate (Ap4A) HIT family hydrolase
VAFALHGQLAKDCTLVGDLPVCRVLLMGNKLFPWLILVPMREGKRELFDLSDVDYPAVMEEIRLVSERFAHMTGAHKINIAALGNMVPQLHIHVIARFEADAAWPYPVWNAPGKPENYSAEEREALVKKFKQLLGLS